MSDNTTPTLEDLLTNYYVAHVLKVGSEADAVAEIKRACVDPTMAAQAKEKLAGLDALHAQVGDISKRDFSGHVARIGLRKALGGNDE